MARGTGDRAIRPAHRIDSAGTGNYHTHALTRGLLILEILAKEPPPLTLSNLHEQSGLPKSTLVRLLSALAELQFVVRVDERPAYRLGHKVMDLARSYVNSLDISQVAGDYLAELSDRSRQTSNLGVLDGDRVLHVCVRAPDRPLRFQTEAGARAPTYCTGLGKMLLAGLDPTMVDQHLPAGSFEAFVDRTIVDRDVLRRELRRTAERGYAFDDNEHSDGLRCLAVPVTAIGAVLAAVSISGPSAEFDAGHRAGFLEQLRTTADQLAGDPEVVDALRNIRLQTRGSAPQPG
jgi:DNA-binding IclR family transcriptional regulator